MHPFHPVSVGSLRRLCATWAGLALLVACGWSAQPPIEMHAEASRQFYSEGVDTTVYVQARIRVADLPADQVPASVRNVALLIDRSGSMAGEIGRASWRETV